MGKYFGVMLDMSRNGVMKVETLKKYVDYLSAFGYNMLQLYTEDTYEVDGEPYFGYLRGGYKKSELKEIDAYCKKKGIELVPCIQTLAHLNTIFKWPAYAVVNDTANILLVDDPRTYQLIDNMFATIAECYTSRRVHIGMDEAHMVGLGQYLDKHGYCNRFELLNKHLAKVVEIAKKYGFDPMMWSDMFFRIANSGEYYGRDPKLPQELIDGVPSDVSLVYWDYYHDNKDDYRAMISAHQKFGRDIWFAGGAWSWIGFAPANQYTLRTMKPALDVCREEGMENIFMTMWGDNGRECSLFALLPSLYYMKRYYDGETDKKVIEKEFQALTGEAFDHMMNLDLPNFVGGDREGFRNPCKFMLYSDPFFGWLDTQAKENVGDEYKKLARKFSLYAGQSSSFSYLYDFYAKLCRVLSTKYDLGVKLRAAYQANDRAALEELVGTFKKTEKNLRIFHEAFRALWHKENKPHGFEVQDARLGGLAGRLDSCKKRLQAYLREEEDSLPELEEELLDYAGKGKEYSKETPCCNDWLSIITVNQLW